MHPAPQTSPSQDVGFKYEARAAIYLQDHGLHILQRNARTQVGEIDLIATDGLYLIFVEVRYRANHRYGGALASVNRSKQWRIIRSAQSLLPMLGRRYFSGKTPPYRFDVIAIDDLKMHWITNAFGE